MKAYFIKIKYILPLLGLLIASSCEEDAPVEIIQPKTDLFINGNVNHGTINFPFVGAVALGAGEIPPFFVRVSAGVTAVEVTNRYTLPAPNNTVTKFQLLGSFPVSNGVAEIPAILISGLRNPSDPAIITTVITGTPPPQNGPGANNLLVDAVLEDGTRERRIVPLTLSRTYINFNSDPFRLFLDGNYGAGVDAFTVKVSGDVAQVRVTNRYALPNTTATKDQLIGLYTVDPLTRLATVPAADLLFSKLRQPTDPAITGRADIGLNTFRVEAIFTSTPTGAVQLKTALIDWK